MIHAAAPCPVDAKRQMIDWWGPVIDEYYAASEGGGTLVNTEDWLKKPGTVGTRLADLGDRHLRRRRQPGRGAERDRHRLHGHGHAAGDFEYHKDKEKTEKNRIGKFFTVGDVGYLDEDGYLFLRDRKIDMIISGGANIYPAEIENVLLGHPRSPTSRSSASPTTTGARRSRPSSSRSTASTPRPSLADEILAFCEGRLAKFKTPKTIDFVDELPRDPNGKLYKRKLRDPYWEGVERAV